MKYKNSYINSNFKKFISERGYISPDSCYLMFLIEIKFMPVNNFEHLKYLLKMMGGAAALLALSKIKKTFSAKIHDISGYKRGT